MKKNTFNIRTKDLHITYITYIVLFGSKSTSNLGSAIFDRHKRNEYEFTNEQNFG